jgi:phosphoesterase RecJ-like protein
MLEKILDLIKNSAKFVITSHVNPDGDSIGSEIALYKYLINKEKEAKIINYSLTPRNYLFLDSNNIIEKFDENRHKKSIYDADVIFILDTNEYSRLRTMAPLIKESQAKKICIDHHLGENNGFDYYLSDIESASTGEILFRLFTLNGSDSINKDIAVPLYTAIMTDTGSFRFPRTDSETHQITAKLIEKGADPVEIFSEVYDKAPFGRLKLLSRFLNNLTLAYDGKLIYGPIYLKDFEDTETNVFDTEGFSHHIMGLGSVQIGIIFTETQKGIKVSFRSKGEIYCNELAKEFGGGGHKNAAGAWIDKVKMESLIKEVITKAKKYLK